MTDELERYEQLRDCQDEFDRVVLRSDRCVIGKREKGNVVQTLCGSRDGHYIAFRKALESLWPAIRATAREELDRITEEARKEAAKSLRDCLDSLGEAPF